jgi:hypothetical protein
LFLMLLMIAMWLPEGKNQGAEDIKFKGNKEVLDRKIAAASSPQNYDDLDRFCREATEANREAVISRMLGKVGVRHDVYAQNKDNAEWRAGLSKKALKAVKWLDGHTVKVKEIKVTELVSNSSIKLVYDITNREGTATGLRIGGKVIISVVSSILTAIIAFGRKGVSVDAIADLGLWTVTIVNTILSSLRAGRQLVTVVRQDFILRNISFLDAFDSWRIRQGKQAVTQIEKET